MGNAQNRYTELLLDFGLEGFVPLKWCQNKPINFALVPKKILKLILARHSNRIRLTITESPQIKVVVDLI